MNKLCSLVWAKRRAGSVMVVGTLLVNLFVQAQAPVDVRLRWAPDLRTPPEILACSPPGSTIATYGAPVFATVEVHAPPRAEGEEVGIVGVEMQEVNRHACQYVLVRNAERPWYTNCVGVSPDEAYGQYALPGPGIYPDHPHDSEWVLRVYAKYRLSGGEWSAPIASNNFPFTLHNLRLFVKGPNEDHVFVWDPDNPLPEGTRTVHTRFSGAQRSYQNVYLLIYNMAGDQIIRTITMRDQDLPNTPITFIWDGRNDAGEFMEEGVYGYEVTVGSSPALEHRLLQTTSGFLRSVVEADRFASFQGLDDDNNIILHVEYSLNERDFRLPLGEYPYSNCPTASLDAESGDLVLYSNGYERARKSIAELTCLTSANCLAKNTQHKVEVKISPEEWPAYERGFIAVVINDQREHDDPKHESRKPVTKVMEAGSPAVHVAAGWHHSLATLRDGTLWAWGVNASGQLGNGARINSHQPIRVLGQGGKGVLKEVAMAAGGYDHSSALLLDSSVYTWGNNLYGQLGDGTRQTRLTPIPVKGDAGVGFLSGIESIAAGASHTLAVSGSDGQVFAWGSNSVGELGDGTTIDRTTPVKVKTTVGDMNAITSALAASIHSLALRSDHGVWSWGRSVQGELGSGFFRDQRVKAEPVVDAQRRAHLQNIRVISAHFNHSLARDKAGQVWAWGFNLYGMLGDATLTDRALPVAVKGPGGVGALNNIATVSAGGTSSYALDVKGKMWAWGWNRFGQLGDGTRDEQQTTPVRVKNATGTGDLDKVSALAMGGSGNWHTLVIRQGEVWAWGGNTFGELGDGTTTDRNLPVKAKFP